MTPEKKKEQEVSKEIERVQKKMMDFSDRLKKKMEPLLEEIKKDIKEGDVNIANNKVQTAIMPLLFSLPPANALGVLDLLNMQIRSSLAKTRKPIEVRKKPASTPMFG